MTGGEHFVLAGHIVYTPDKNTFSITENGYLVCEGGHVTGVFATLPERFSALPLYRYTDCLIIPGLCDTHVHAPQYAFRGLGMDLELIDWLDRRAFPQELRYADLAYAERAYGQFVSALTQSATTRAAVFGTIHVPATLRLMEMLEKTGLRCLVGKVNMDRNAPDGLRDPEPDEALEQTEKWVKQALSRFERTRPILTPRFMPSCTDRLMEGLGELQRAYGLPVQSHLSENVSEVEWVRELCPWAESYGGAYARYGLFGGAAPTVMAHCVHPTDAEFDLIRRQDVLVSHCPASNANLSSGVAPVGRYLEAGIRVGLGTDVAGGFDLSIFRAMTDAVQFSKLRAHFMGMRERPVTLCEAFYMGTKGGGTLFGKVGSFEPGYLFDAVVLNDHRLKAPGALSIQERLERAVYLEKDVVIEHKFVQGSEITGGVPE